MKSLLALDGSKCSEATADTVAGRFVSKNTEAHLLHAREPYPAMLAEEIGGKDSPDFVAARTRQRERAEDFLRKAAEKLRADLIVAGSHGRKRRQRFLIGSVSAAVSRYARC